MSYQKQNFANGEVLTAPQLNHIEDGIVDLESAVNENKGVVDNIIDPTLSLSGKAADAKATGDAIRGVRDDLASEISRAEQRKKPTLTTSRLRSPAHKPPKAPYPLKSRRRRSGQRRRNRRTRTGLPLKHPAPRARSSA